MKTLPFALLALHLVPSVSWATSIRVEVSEIREAKGALICLLFETKDGFPADATKAKARTSAPIRGKNARCAFDEVSSGEYAVAAIHDEDGDGKLDTNFLGKPTEGVCVSRNAKGSFGPPKFSDAAFEVTAEGAQLAVRMRY